MPALRPAAAGRRALIARLALILATLLVAIAAPGCGGDDEPAASSPVTEPELTVPQPDEADEPETETETAPEPPPETTAPPADEAPVPEAEPPPDTPENDTPPPQDSPAERFEEFCDENPGACG